MVKIYIKEVRWCYDCPALKRVDDYRLRCDFVNEEFWHTEYHLSEMFKKCPLEDRDKK